jgi:hypothetical protein
MFEGPPGEAIGAPPALLIFCPDIGDDGGGATATIATFKGSSSPPFRIALSKAMPNEESAPPFARAAASVTCPISFVPLGMMVFPSARMSAVVRAFTASPCFIFLESTEELSSATIGEPSASEAFSRELSAETADGAAEAELAVCVPACACVWHAAEPAKTSAPKIMNPVRFI